MRLLTPRSRPGLSYRDAVALIKSLSSKELGKNEMVMLGVRGYYRDSLGKKGANDRGLYDDAIFIVTGTGIKLINSSYIASFNANVDPSIFRRSIANLKPGEYKYQTGFHNITKPGRMYPAFRQASLVTVVRDQVGEVSGWFGINIHKGGILGTSSEGCQTIAPKQWDEFITTAYTALGIPPGASQLKSGAKAQKEFRYILLADSDLDNVLGKGWRS